MSIDLSQYQDQGAVISEKKATWYNENHQIHRDDGPAEVFKDGKVVWYQNGKPHRRNGPAVIMPNGANYWYLYGIRFWDMDAFIKYGKMTDEEIQYLRTNYGDIEDHESCIGCKP